MELKDVTIEIPAQEKSANNSNKETRAPLQDGHEGIQCGRNAGFCAKYFNKFEACIDVHRLKLILTFKILLFIGYFVYFALAVRYHLGDEGSWRLIGCTILGVVLLAWNLAKKRGWTRGITGCSKRLLDCFGTGRTSTIIRWLLYLAMSVFMVLYVVFAVARKTPENLRSIMGIFGLPFLMFLYSNNKRKVNWHTVFWAMSLQFSMALIILKTTWGASIIRWVGARLTELVSNAEAGSIFMFGKTWTDHPFVFGSMVQVIVLVVCISILTYLGVIKFVVETVGRVLAFGLQTSPPEGINAVANMFLHVPESALLIQEYLPDMTPSQLFVTCAGALSTVGGVSLIIFMSSGVPAAPLVAASAMSAPAALAAAKLVFPSHDEEEAPKAPENKEGMSRAQLMSYVFYPFAFLMGARHEDCLFIGELLGIRTFSLAVVAYPVLGPIMTNGRDFRAYIAEDTNNTWTQMGSDIMLDNWNKTLVGGVIDPRSEIIATYSLCGSASLAIMGLIIGSYQILVPHRIGEVTQHVFRAMVAGTVASYLTASFAGLLFEESVQSY